MIKKFEKFIKDDEVLLIVDVQKSFSKYFTKKYIEDLTKYCENFNEVYVIWDNHHEGKVNPDYLYQGDPPPPNKGELYQFPNTVEEIEKRYNYDVDVTFYKNILPKIKYTKILELEKNKNLKKGDLFKTNHGTAIVYIGNNHVWFHISKKLLKTLISLSNKKVTIVGGSSNECLEDIYITAKSLGLNISKDIRYIWDATNCPIS